MYILACSIQQVKLIINKQYINTGRSETVKITININPEVQETEITVSCSQLTVETEKLLAAIRMLNQQLTVTKEDAFGVAHYLYVYTGFCKYCTIYYLV